MKNRVLCILLFLAYILYACDSEPTADFPTQIIQHSEINDSIFEILLDDAHLICLDFYTNEGMQELQNIEIRESHVAPILSALQTVYADSVTTAALDIRKYNVHALCPEQIHKINITVDTTSSLIKSWRNFGFTDNLNLDLLIDEYDLQLDSTGINSYLLSSANELNQEALAKKISEFPDILQAQAFNCDADGSQIEIIYFSPDYIQLVYSYGWGECESGCIHRHYWELGIYGNGFVELISESGKALPNLSTTAK